MYHEVMRIYSASKIFFALSGWLADMTQLSVVPAIVPVALTELLRGGGADDPEQRAKKVLEWQKG